MAISSSTEVFAALCTACQPLVGTYGGVGATARWLAWHSLGGLTGVSIEQGRAALNDSEFYGYYDSESRFYDEVFNFAVVLAAS